METATAILKNLIIPRLEKDSNFRQQQNGNIFWTEFTANFLNYEKDPKPVFVTIYSLELEDPERILKKLPAVYNSFTEELAEQYVLGNKSEAMDRLHQNGDVLFREHVTFFRELKNAATYLERKRMIEEMPATYAALSNEISDDAIQAVIKKEGREELRNKFKVWDEEMKEEIIDLSSAQYSYSLPHPNERPDKKIKELPTIKTAAPKSGDFPFKWVYAIAAVLLIGFFIWQPTQQSGSELFNSYAGNKEVLSKIDLSELGGTNDGVATRGGEFQLSGLTQNESEKAFEAISYFQEQQFFKSKRILEGISLAGKNDDLLLFLAITQLNTGEIDRAVENLEELQVKSRFRYEQVVQFHLALGYLQQGNNRRAKTLLKRLEVDQGKFSVQASQILGDMRWF